MGIKMIYRCVLVEGFYYTVMFVNGDFMRVRGSLSLRWVVLQFNVTGGFWWLFGVNFQQQLGGIVGGITLDLESLEFMRKNEGILVILWTLDLSIRPILQGGLWTTKKREIGWFFEKLTDIKPKIRLKIVKIRHWSKKCRNSRSKRSKKRWNC